MAGYFSDLGPSVSEMLGPSIARETNRALSPPPENAPSTDSLDNVPIFYGNIAPGDEDSDSKFSFIVSNSVLNFEWNCLVFYPNLGENSE